MRHLDFASPYKIIHHPEKIEEMRSGKNIFPIQVEIHPTLICNHRCVKCITDVIHITGYEKFPVTHDDQVKIPLDRMLGFLNEFKAMGVKTLTFSGGGDPLLYPEIDKVMARAHALGLEYGIITNLAMPLNEGKLKAIRQASWVRVSLDAATESSYEILHQTPKGHFDLVIENMRKLAGHTFVGINYLVQDENYKDIVKGAELARDLGVNYIRFAPIFDDSFGECYKPHWDEIASLMDQATQLSNETLTVFAFKKRFQDLFVNDKSYDRCYIQELHPVLGADMKIYTCCNFPYVKDFVVTEIGKRSFQEAWLSEERLNYVKKFDPKKWPSCWYNQQNKFMNYLLADNPQHAKFV